MMYEKLINDTKLGRFLTNVKTLIASIEKNYIQKVGQIPTGTITTDGNTVTVDLTTNGNPFYNATASDGDTFLMAAPDWDNESELSIVIRTGHGSLTLSQQWSAQDAQTGDILRVVCHDLDTSAEELTIFNLSEAYRKANSAYQKLQSGIPKTDLASAVRTSLDKADTALQPADISAWAKAANKPSYNFSEIGSTPTTIAGYGITDAYTKTEIDSLISAVFKPAGSVAFASLPSPTAANLGYVYTVTDAFTTDNTFVEGAGKSYPAGTNVVVVYQGSATYMFDVLTGSVDLSGYYTKTETDSLLENTPDFVEEETSAAELEDEYATLRNNLYQALTDAGVQTEAAQQAATLAAEKATAANNAANAANNAATNANNKANKAHTEANYAEAQGDYAKQQGDYAKQQAEIIVNMEWVEFVEDNTDTNPFV